MCLIVVLEDANTIDPACCATNQFMHKDFTPKEYLPKETNNAHHAPATVDHAFKPPSGKDEGSIIGFLNCGAASGSATLSLIAFSVSAS